MEKTIIKIPATIENVKTTDDRCLEIKVGTQEMDPKTAGDIMMLKGSLGWFLFSNEEVRQEDLINLPEIKREKGKKTESQRLRAVLYLLWERKQIGTFEGYYKNYMERVIEKLKEGLS